MKLQETSNVLIIFLKTINKMLNIISDEHFQQMKMMCDYFKKNSEKNELYLPEYSASKEINFIIENENDLVKAKNKIVFLLEEVKNTEHFDGSHWHDYEIHVKAILREN